MVFFKQIQFPLSCWLGKFLKLQVKLTNNSKKIWYGYGTHPVLLCYHWQNTDGGYLIYDGMRTELKNQSCILANRYKKWSGFLRQAKREASI